MAKSKAMAPPPQPHHGLRHKPAPAKADAKIPASDEPGKIPRHKPVAIDATPVPNRAGAGLATPKGAKPDLTTPKTIHSNI